MITHHFSAHKTPVVMHPPRDNGAASFSTGCIININTEIAFIATLFLKNTSTNIHQKNNPIKTLQKSALLIPSESLRTIE